MHMIFPVFHVLEKAKLNQQVICIHVLSTEILAQTALQWTAYKHAQNFFNGTSCVNNPHFIDHWTEIGPNKKQTALLYKKHVISKEEFYTNNNLSKQPVWI